MSGAVDPQASGGNAEQNAGAGETGAERTVLCGANSYEQRYYFNPAFAKLPDEIKKELQIMCVSFTEIVGGIFLVEFDKEGNLKLTTQVDDADIYHDEIESGIQISRLQREKEELFGQLELFYKIISGTNGGDN